MAGSPVAASKCPRWADSSSTIGSFIKTALALLGVAGVMVLETYLSIYLLLKVFALSPSDSAFTIVIGCVLFFQIFSYGLSPMILRRQDRAWPDSEFATAKSKWLSARPLTCLPVGHMKGGQALGWGVVGKFFFAPCMFKMKWVGKTVHSQDLVSMLEFGAVNCVPLPTFTLGPVSTATVVRTDVDGKESLALAYNYLPIVDHIRRLDKDTIIGKMMIGKVTVLYFTLKCKE